MLIGRTSRASYRPREGGEGYLASSADLMIGILFIFIIVVVYLAAEIKRVQDANGTATDPVATLVGELGRRLAEQKVKVELDPQSGVVALPADALFDQGQSVPKPDALAVIAQTNRVLQEVLPCYVDDVRHRSDSCITLNKRGVRLETVMVEGHTDSTPFANDPNRNWHLGLDRARYIFTSFDSGPLGALKNSKGQPLLGVSSYADSRPSKIAVNSADPLAKDRRVELRFILSYQSPETIGPATDVQQGLVKR